MILWTRKLPTTVVYETVNIWVTFISKGSFLVCKSKKQFYVLSSKMRKICNITVSKSRIQVSKPNMAPEVKFNVELLTNGFDIFKGLHWSIWSLLKPLLISNLLLSPSYCGRCYSKDLQKHQTIQKLSDFISKTPIGPSS